MTVLTTLTSLKVTSFDLTKVSCAVALSTHGRMSSSAVWAVGFWTHSSIATHVSATALLFRENKLYLGNNFPAEQYSNDDDVHATMSWKSRYRMEKWNRKNITKRRKPTSRGSRHYIVWKGLDVCILTRILRFTANDCVKENEKTLKWMVNQRQYSIRNVPEGMHLSLLSYISIMNSIKRIH